MTDCNLERYMVLSEVLLQGCEGGGCEDYEWEA